MIQQTAALKPSMQKLADAHAAMEQVIKAEESRPLPDQIRISQLKREKLQLKEMIGHLSMKKRIKVTSQYVFNMYDSVLELLREYLQEERITMLRGGKNEKSRQYIDCSNELKVVSEEQRRRKRQPSNYSPASIVRCIAV
jgi:hypothetical protein